MRRIVVANVNLTVWRKWLAAWIITIVALCLGCRLTVAQMTTHSETSQVVPFQQTHILDSVPEPNDEEIRKIRTAKQWHNPYVMVYGDDYELILHDQSRTAVRMSLGELEEALLKMPLEQWPLGRVVAVSEIGLRNPDDNEKVTKNLEELKCMLLSHKLRVDLWPSG